MSFFILGTLQLFMHCKTIARGIQIPWPRPILSHQINSLGMVIIIDNICQDQNIKIHFRKHQIVSMRECITKIFIKVEKVIFQNLSKCLLYISQDFTFKYNHLNSRKAMDQKSSWESGNLEKQQRSTDFFEESLQNQQLPPLLEPDRQDDNSLFLERVPSEQDQDGPENQIDEESNKTDQENELELSSNTPIEEQVFEQERIFIKIQAEKYKGEIMKESIKENQEKNIPRFLVRMFIKYFEEYKDEFSSGTYQQLRAHCEKQSNRVKNNKKNVFLMKNLKELLDNESQFGKECCKTNRRVFLCILSKYAISEMFLPRSQIKKNKKKYLQTAKVFKLRCRCKNLVNRLQSQ